MPDEKKKKKRCITYVCISVHFLELNALFVCSEMICVWLVCCSVQFHDCLLSCLEMSLHLRAKLSVVVQQLVNIFFRFVRDFSDALQQVRVR